MLGRKLTFESPNAIDAGDDQPPLRLGRATSPTSSEESLTQSFSSTRSPRSVVRVQERVVRDERLFRGTKIKIENSDCDMDDESQRRSRFSTSAHSSEIVFNPDDDYEDEPISSHPTASEARLYAAKVLEDLGLDSDNDEEQAQEEVRPLAWRRPSRRKTTLASTGTFCGSNSKTPDARNSWIYLSKSVLCGLLLLASAVAFFVVVTLAVVRSNDRDSVEDAGPQPLPSGRLLLIIDWLVHHTVSDPADLSKTGTPQFQAAEWLANVDALQYAIPSRDGHDKAFMGEENKQFVQRYILALLYFVLGGENWNHDLLFLSDNHICGWFRSERAADGTQHAMGVTCDNDLSIRGIFMPKNNVKGTLPVEIQHLSKLQMLSLRDNFISGSFPENLQYLSESLQYLDLTNTGLMGPLPSQTIGSLHKLKVLELGGNQLTGTIPIEFSALTNLVTLDLEGNSLRRRIKTSLGKLTNLEYLYLGNNLLDDTIDDLFLANFIKLRELKLNSNKFVSIEGELPMHLLAHPALTLLDLSDNFLQATLPGFLPLHYSLEYLNLSSNNLLGEIPISIQFFTNLKYLDLSRNDLTGSIPASLGNTKTLTHLHLHENPFFSGPVPQTFFNLENLRELSLGNSGFTGQIPTWFGLMSNLTYLSLKQNQLSGEIPGELWEVQLSVLLLSENQLSGSIEHFERNDYLEVLTLNDNAVTGDASIVCAAAPRLNTFSYPCNAIECVGHCCHPECCGLGEDRANQCFSALIDTSLQMRKADNSFLYHTNSTADSLSPSMALDGPIR